MRLSRPQCQSLRDERSFVADRLNDPLAVQTAQALADYVSRRRARPYEDVWVTSEGAQATSANGRISRGRHLGPRRRPGVPQRIVLR